MTLFDTGNGLNRRPILSSVLIVVLAGGLLQLSNIIGFQDSLDSFLPGFVPVRLVDIVFRMTMGAVLVLVAIPRLLGLATGADWVGYGRVMRWSMGTSPKKTMMASLFAVAAFVFLLAGLAAAVGVIETDFGVLVDDDRWLILLAALVPAVWEELAFRGVVLAGLERNSSPFWAVVLSAVFFGLFHFSNLVNWEDAESVVAGVVAATAFGIGWGYIVIRTNSIIPAMINHYLVDVILFDELFIDPIASDDTTSAVYLGLIVLYPLATILITRALFGKGTAPSSRDAPEGTPF